VAFVTGAARDARVLLLSDCVHNAGPDPRPLATRLPRLDVLGTPPVSRTRGWPGAATGGCAWSVPIPTSRSR
jgi:hypothetical protein